MYLPYITRADISYKTRVKSLTGGLGISWIDGNLQRDGYILLTWNRHEVLPGILLLICIRTLRVGLRAHGMSYAVLS